MNKWSIWIHRCWIRQVLLQNQKKFCFGWPQRQKSKILQSVCMTVYILWVCYRFPALRCWRRGYRCSSNSTTRASEGQAWTWSSSRTPWYIWWRCPASSAPPAGTPCWWEWAAPGNNPSPSWPPSLPDTRPSKSPSQGQRLVFGCFFRFLIQRFFY